jgi:hypothetical protein
MTCRSNARRSRSGGRRWLPTRSDAMDAGQAMIALVLGITVIISTGGAILAANVIQHDPLVQTDVLEHYAYRAVEAGANTYLATVNANPNEMNCHYRSTNVGQCPSTQYRKWIAVPETGGGNGTAPEYFYWTDPVFCFSVTKCTTPTENTTTAQPLAYVKETIYGAAGYTNHIVYGKITGDFQSENGFLTHVWWSDYESSDPVSTTHLTAACTWNWNNTYTGPNILPPTLTSVTPSSGSTAGGTVVTLTGTGFVSGATITFGTLPATTVTFVNKDKITARAPARASGTVTVVVKTVNGTSNGRPYTYRVTTPTLTKVTPAAGPVGGGNIVTLTGSGFFPGATVAFGTKPGTTVHVVNGAEITAKAPAHTGAGSVTVTVTVTGHKTGSVKYLYELPPTITSFTPTAGPTAGGTTVTITGTNFTAADEVRFGATTATAYTVTSSTTIRAIAKAHAAGTVKISVATIAGTATSTSSYRYVPPPAVTGFSPAAGSTTGGTVVTITGSNLTGATSVKFGTAAVASFTVTSATTIKAVTRTHSPGTVTISVTTSGGSSTSATTYTFVPPPTISGFSPTAGPIAGGTTVTITGANFTGATAVTFGTTAAASFTVTSPTTIKAVTRAHAAGTAKIQVTTSGGTATSGSAFKFEPHPTVTGFTPTHGYTTGNTTVTITGTALTGTTGVKFGTTAAASFTVTSPTTIKAVTRAHAAGTVTIQVTTGGGVGTGPGTYTFVVPPPTITGFTPTAGPTTGGTTVTVTGTNFTGATAVKFGTAAAAGFTVTSPTTIKATTRSHAAGTVRIQVTTPGGTVTSTGSFRFQAAPTITGFTPSPARPLVARPSRSPGPTSPRPAPSCSGPPQQRASPSQARPPSPPGLRATPPAR